MLCNHAHYSKAFIHVRDMNVPQPQVAVSLLGPCAKRFLRYRPLPANGKGEAATPREGTIVHNLSDDASAADTGAGGITSYIANASQFNRNLFLQAHNTQDSRVDLVGVRSDTKAFHTHISERTPGFMSLGREPDCGALVRDGSIRQGSARGNVAGPSP